MVRNDLSPSNTIPKLMKKITLNIDQRKALEQMVDFLDDKDCRIFILRGYAGTGKTTLMNFLINNLKQDNRHFQLLASTGRAAKILSNILDIVPNEEFGVKTIHSLIYSFSKLNVDLSNQEITDCAKFDDQIFLIFKPRSLAESSSSTIYIIDEASMIADKEQSNNIQAKFGEGRLLKELLDYDPRPGSKFIFVGDPCQLPPCDDVFSPALSPKYFEETFSLNVRHSELTLIMRQDNENELIPKSMIIRKLYQTAPEYSSYYKSNSWMKLPFRNCNNIIFYDSLGTLISSYVKDIRTNGNEKSIMITRSNRNCLNLSERIRTELGKQADEPLSNGDILIVVQNNMISGLSNGDMVRVMKIYPRRVEIRGLHFLEVEVQELASKEKHTQFLIEELLHQTDVNLDSNRQTELFIDFITRMKKKGINQKDENFSSQMKQDPYLNALRCAWGYAITCHKAQGGEWERVYLDIGTRNLMLNPTKSTYQWIYTAMTRAKKQLFLVNDFFYE